MRNDNSDYLLALTNIKKSLNEYEKPNRSKRDAEEDADKDISGRLDVLHQRQFNIDDLADKNDDLITSIKEKLSKARGALEGMTKPAIKFERGSSLELKNPDNLEDLTTKTRVSFYVKGVGSKEDVEEEKRDERAFLFYMGHLEGTKQMIPQELTDDYMALQVLKDGKVSMTMDLGSGPITLDSQEALKANDWYQIVVDRQGRNVKLIVRSETGPGEITEDEVQKSFPLLDGDGRPLLSGSVFNLHPEFTKIYVGGFPTASSGVQDTVRSTDMDGKVEGLVIGDKEVGLWNYKEATRITGDNTRTKFVPKQSFDLSFEGNGYVKLDPINYYLAEMKENNIQFEFRADQPNGLMFLAGGVEDGFISVGLKDSYVVFSFMVGSDGDLVTITSNSTVNLDTWYMVRAERDGSEGKLFINRELVGGDISKTYTGDSIPTVTDLYIGGYPGSDYDDKTDTTFFTGCVKEATIGSDNIDVSDTAGGVTKQNVGNECTRQVETMVSFTEASSGFINMDSVAVDGSITVSVSFRTVASDGLLLYMREITGNHFVSLSLSGGALYLYAFPYTKIPVKNPETQELIEFNDNKWHTVSISILDDPNRMVILQIDDFIELNRGPVEEIPLVYSTKYETFLGGISQSVQDEIPSDAFMDGSPFIGCIRDAVVMDKLLDFSKHVEMEGASFGECGVTVAVPETVDESDDSSEQNVAKPEPEEEYDPLELFPGLYTEGDSSPQIQVKFRKLPTSRPVIGNSFFN